MLYADGYRMLEDLILTPRALSFMRQLYRSSQCSGEAGLRLTVRSEGWAGLGSTLTAEPRVRTDERPLLLPGLRLFLNRESARLLDGVLIDCEEVHGRLRLSFLDLPSDARMPAFHPRDSSESKRP